MIRKFSIFAIFLMMLQVLLPLSNVFAADIVIQAPTNLKANQYYPGNIVLSWDKVTGAGSYRVYEIVDGEKEFVKEVSYKNLDTTVPSVPEGSSSFAVAAVRLGTESELSNMVTVEVLYPVMESPLNVVSTVANGNDLTISWDKVTYATDYNIYQVVDGTRTLVATTKTNSHTFVNHLEGDFTYEVTAYNSRFGESSVGSTIEGEVIFPEIQAPIVTYKIQGGNDLVFNWQRTLYASNYRVYEVVDGERNLMTTTRLNSHLISNVSEGKHVYEITTFSDRFGESEVPFRIEIDMAFPEMQSPGSLTYTLSNYNDINLRWTQAEYADFYKLYQYINGEKKLILSTPALNTIYKNMPEGHYQYEVAAYSERFGESEQVAKLEFDLDHPDMLPPKNPIITVQNGNDLVLRWDVFEFATAYKVYQIIDGEQKLISTRVGNAHTLLNMPEGKYTFEITSYHDRFGESSTGTQIEYDMVFPELQAPELTGIVKNENTIRLDWTKKDFAGGYNVYQVIDGTKKFVGTTTSQYLELRNQSEGTYTFEVTTYHSRFGESTPSNQVDLYIGPKLEAPQTAGSAVENDSVTLNWSGVKDAESYNVYEVVNGERKLVENTTETSLTISELEPKHYEYIIVPVSQSGVESDEYATIQIGTEEFDTTPPVTTSNISEEFLNEDLEVQLTATDSQSGVSKTYYSINRSDFVEGTKFTLNTEGQYEISFYSVDNVGNEEEVNTVEVLLDKVAPVTTSNVSDTIIELTATDNLSGVDKTYYSINGSEFIEGTSFTLDEVGTHQVSFYSVDKAGNVEEVQTVEVNVDNIAPVTTSNVSDNWYKEEVEVQLTATDDFSGVDKTFYSINGSEFTEGTSFTLTEAGTHQVSFYSVDKAGNVEEVRTVEVNVDNVAPVTTSNVSDNWYKEEVEVQLTATDDFSGVDKTFYSIDGSEFTEGINFTLSEEGTHNVSFYTTDKAGNEELVQTAEVRIDKTAPVVSWNPESEYALGSTLNLDYSANDAVSGIANKTVTINGEAVDNVNEITLDKPGTYKVIITVTDNAGWTTTLEKEAVVYIPVTLEVLPKVIKGNDGIFTVKAIVPQGFNSAQFDISSATLNGVKAEQDSKGLEQQAKKGQFKFERANFQWNEEEVVLEFRAMLGDYLVVGSKTVKVIVK